MRVLALLLAAVIALAQPKPARVEGFVTTASGEAVRKAVVRLRAITGEVILNFDDVTDEQGRFVFESVPEGRYLLTAERPGYLTQAHLARPGVANGSPFQVDAGTTAKVTLTLQSQGVVSGRVLDEDGDPVSGTTVVALSARFLAGQRQLTPAGIVTSDDQGNFRISRLAPGRYYLAAGDRNNGRSAGRTGIPGRATTQTALAITYYPGVTDAGSAAPLSIPAGREISGIDLKMRPTRVFALRGIVTAPPGVPVLGSVTLIPRNAPLFGNLRGSAPVRPDGTFEFRNIEPGPYILLANTGARQDTSGRPVPALTARTEIETGTSDLSGVVVDLRPAGQLSGTLKVEGGSSASAPEPSVSAAPQVQIRLPNGELGPPINQPPLSAGPGPQITLNDAEGLNIGFSTTRAAADGTFSLANIAPGVFTLNVAPLAEDTYVRSIRLGDRDVTSARLDFRNAVSGPLNIVLSRTAAMVDGVARDRDGKPIAFATVAVWPKGQGRPAALATDHTGAFHFARLAPGDYWLSAWEDVDPGLAQNPDFLARFTSTAKTIRVEASGRAAADAGVESKVSVDAALAALP